MIHLTEPQRGITLLLNLYSWMNESATREHILPILADVFVFTYPVYLGVMYLYGKFKKQVVHKIITLQIFTSVFISIIANIVIQLFFDKSRPNFVLGFVDEKTESLFHKFLPSSSFPSDHAVVSMSIATASIILGIQKKQPIYTIIGIILVLFSLITSFSRVAISIHRPTDVIAGICIGIIVPLLLSNQKFSNFLEKKIFAPITKIF